MLIVFSSLATLAFIAVIVITMTRLGNYILLEKFMLWLIFGIAFSLLPMILSVMRVYVTGESLSMSKILGNGELLITSAAINADSISRLATSSWRRATAFRGIILGLCVLILALNSAFFGMNTFSGSEFSVQRITEISVISFTSTLFIGSLCFLVYEPE